MINPLFLRELRKIPQLKKGLTHYGRFDPWPEGATPLCPGDLAKKAKLMRRPKRQECYIRNAVIAEDDPAYSTKPITKWGHAPIGVRFLSVEHRRMPQKALRIRASTEHRRHIPCEGKAWSQGCGEGARQWSPRFQEGAMLILREQGDIGSEMHANGLTQRLAPAPPGEDTFTISKKRLQQRWIG